jgi:hypothetical protein
MNGTMLLIVVFIKLQVSTSTVMFSLFQFSTNCTGCRPAKELRKHSLPSGRSTTVCQAIKSASGGFLPVVIFQGKVDAFSLHVQLISLHSGPLDA